MIAFQHIEDYVQFIAGTRDINNRTTSFWMAQPPISLARYDKSVVSSFAEQIERSVAFTDRQSELAKRLVSKYKKQLARLNVSMPDDVETIPFRYGIRQVDRTRRMYIKDDKLVLLFPYNTEMINMIKEYAKNSPGDIHYVHEDKQWSVALTEGCVNWAVAFGKAFQFEIPEDVEELANKIIQSEAVAYAIQLCRINGQLTITNATDSLIEYIDTHLGGVNEENLDQLMSMAGELGYDISEELLANNEFAEFLQTKAVQVIPSDTGLKRIVDYATRYNKFPIISFAPSSLGAEHLEKLSGLFNEDEVVHLNTLRTPKAPPTERTRLIHMGTKSAKAFLGTAPIVICYGNMSFGSVNALLVQRAGKVFYYCNPIIKAD